MKAELAVGREMDVTGRRRITDARTIAERQRTLELGEPEGLSVEPSSSGFLARRIEDLGVMQGNPHGFESRREITPVFHTFRGLSFQMQRERRCCLGDRAEPAD